MKWPKKEEYRKKLSDRGINWPSAGFEVGPGWMNLVTKLLDNIISLGWDKDLHQIKQKFCGMRFYVGNASAEIRALIDKAEEKAHDICEYCGIEGLGGVDKVGMNLCPICETISNFIHEERISTYKTI